MDNVDEDEVVTEMTTLLDMLRWTVSKFNAVNLYYGHGTDNPWDEAIQLILPNIFLPLNAPIEMYNARLISSERYKLIKIVMRRINERIPIPYINNIAWFCGVEFYVDQRVFIPRSPIGELIKNNFYDLLPYSPLHILDMCTGSGCIAISCAYIYQNAEIDAIDITDEVLAVTEYNIQLHCMENRVIPMRSDLFKDLPLLSYDLIISNPPYVKLQDIEYLPAEYASEPILSLSGGYDGLELVHKILVNAPDYLTDNGRLICEVGYNMSSLQKEYPNINFHWLHCSKGGYGIFLLTKQQLVEHNYLFKQKTQVKILEEERINGWK